LLLASVALAVVATVADTSIAVCIHQETGPCIVIVAARGFLVSLLRR
jgi:ABC-type Mn2+/Zn2+ transport system permease subunit